MASQGLLRGSWFSVRTCSRIDIGASSISGGAHDVTGKCAPVTASSCARSLLISASRADVASGISSSRSVSSVTAPGVTPASIVLLAICLPACVSFEDNRWLLSSHLHGGASGKRDQFIHRPLVIGVFPVFDRLDLPRGRDQKVGWKSEWAAPKPQAKMAMPHATHGGAEGLRGEKPRRRFHAKFFVEGLLRIANQLEWKILLVRPDRPGGGVKDDHLFDTRRFDFASTPAHFGYVRVADRAVHEAPELQMHEQVRIGQVDQLTGDGFQSCRRKNIA